ncbi:Metallo-beta-lactamase [Gracilaria domingensis]|nr:Metallo-beta-lactamase [Gracilaria domingensis]
MYTEGSYNSMLLTARRRLVIIDSPQPQGPTVNTTRLTDAIPQVLNGTVPYRIDLIYSHSHFDHIGTSRVLVSFLEERYAGAKLLVWGTVETFDIIQRSVTNRSVMPNVRIGKRGRTLRLSRSLTVRLEVVGGHTSSDLRIYIPKSRDGAGSPTTSDFAGAGAHWGGQPDGGVGESKVHRVCDRRGGEIAGVVHGQRGAGGAGGGGAWKLLQPERGGVWQLLLPVRGRDAAAGGGAVLPAGAGGVGVPAGWSGSGGEGPLLHGAAVCAAGAVGGSGARVGGVGVGVIGKIQMGGAARVRRGARRGAGGGWGGGGGHHAAAGAGHFWRQQSDWKRRRTSTTLSRRNVFFGSAVIFVCLIYTRYSMHIYRKEPLRNNPPTARNHKSTHKQRALTAAPTRTAAAGAARAAARRRRRARRRRAAGRAPRRTARRAAAAARARARRRCAPSRRRG